MLHWCKFIVCTNFDVDQIEVTTLRSLGDAVLSVYTLL